MICGNMLAFGFGPMEMIVIGVVGLLVFGNRLPEVGRSLGRGVIEFKKGIKGIEDDMDQADEGIDKEAQSKSNSKAE